MGDPDHSCLVNFICLSSVDVSVESDGGVGVAAIVSGTGVTMARSNVSAFVGGMASALYDVHGGLRWSPDVSVCKG